MPNLFSKYVIDFKARKFFRAFSAFILLVFFQFQNLSAQIFIGDSATITVSGGAISKEIKFFHDNKITKVNSENFEISSLNDKLVVNDISDFNSKKSVASKEKVVEKKTLGNGKKIFIGETKKINFFCNNIPSDSQFYLSQVNDKKFVNVPSFKKEGRKADTYVIQNKQIFKVRKSSNDGFRSENLVALNYSVLYSRPPPTFFA